MVLQRRTVIVSALGFFFFIFFNGMLLLNPSLPSFFSSSDGGSDPLFNWSVQIGYTVSLFLLSFIAFLWRREPFSLPPYATVCLYATGFLLLIVAKSLLSDITTLSALAGFIIGAGSSCCFTSWVQVFKSLGRNQAQWAILIGSVLGILPNTLFFFALPEASLLAEVAVVLPLGLILLVLCSRWTSGTIEVGSRLTVPAQRVQRAQRTQRTQQYRLTFSDLKVPFACIALLSLIAPIAGAATLDAQIDVSIRVWISIIGNTTAAVALFVCWQLVKIPVTFERLGLVIFPLLATAFILLVVLDATYWPFFLFMGDMLFCLVSMLAIYLSIAISLDRTLNIVVVFGAIAGTMCLARLVGWSLGTVIGSIPAFSHYQLPVVAIVLLYAFSILIYFAQRVNKKNNTPLNDSDNSSTVSGNSDSVSLRCENLSKLYHLSTRESEVLDLLAHGRDIPAIAKILFLSENTVRTHTKRLYRSLDIHNRQELIDLLEKT